MSYHGTGGSVIPSRMQMHHGGQSVVNDYQTEVSVTFEDR